MATDREVFQQKLLAAFQDEARDRMRVLADALAVLEQAPTPTLVESVFREIHSLKGAARAVTARAIEQLCQSWESLFAAIRKGHLELQSGHLALSRQAHGALLQLLGNIGNEPASIVRELQKALELAAKGDSAVAKDLTNLNEFGEIKSTSNQPVLTQDPLPQSTTTEWNRLAPAADSLRVSAPVLDTILFKAEELQVVKLQARQNSHNLRDALAEFPIWRKQRHEVTVAAKQLQRLQGDLPSHVRKHQQTLLEYVDWSRDHLGQWEYRLASLAKSAKQLNREISTAVESLQERVQTLLLLPCSRLIEGVPAMLQEMSAEMGKQVTLHVSGDSLQVDKRILDELKSPLQHLLRNAIDHGIETPARRRALGKKEAGRIEIEFRQESATRFELVVTDDGAGMDADELKAKAVAHQLIGADEAESLSEKDALRLAFVSGLSTRDMITELSGRGLGLAIVKEKVERLGGHLDISSKAGAGSRMLIQLPSSLSTHRALLVQVAEQTVAIPALAVERVVRLPWNEIKTVENRLTASYANELLPVALLAEILALKLDQNQFPELAKVVLLSVGGERFCLVVDDILGDQEMVVKSLGPQLKRVRNVLGVSQLGDGRLIPVLHPQDLYQSACRIQTRTLPLKRSHSPAVRSKILVAEDSVTSRSLLRQILENENYDVTTVNDGAEAWETLLQREFDLLVSDIEMPRMDGFILTKKVRESRTLSELPVVLVTALKSPEDREKGLEAGANAYIAKSGFDQSSLLDVIRQLL